MVVPELPTIQDQVLVQSSSSNSNKPINATSTSNNHHTVNLEKFGLKIVALNMLGIQPSPHLLICVDCGCGVPPKSTFDHLKFHNIGITFEDKSKLGEVLVDFKCVDHKAILPIPQPLSGPIQHLKVFNAWKCALCNFCSASPGSFKPHFASLHSTKLGSHASNMVSISAQQYFRNAYCFQVTPSLAGLKHGNPYQLYLKNFKPTLTTIDFFPPPTSVNEINPFLRLTQWHEHLKDFIDTRPKVEALLSLLKLPTSIQGNPALGKPLQYLIDNYLQTIRIQANSTTLGVRCLLMECPRTSQHGEFWQVLANDQSLRDYGRLLHQWIHALITSLDSQHSTHYSFPFSEEQKELAEKLKLLLISTPGDNHLLVFHELVKSILLIHPTESAHCSKWKSIFECLLAISGLKEDGNFKQPREVTQMFAQIAYLIRSSILYEATMNIDRFDGNLYRAVENVAMSNLQPGANSPYNSCMDYQRFASAVAMNSHTAPTTRVNADNDRITYQGKVFSIKAWRSGLQQLASEIKQELAALTLGQDQLIQKPGQIEDDWSNETRGYSWVNQGNFVDDKLQLLKAMLLDPSSKLAIIENEDFQFNATQVWKFLHACDVLTEKLALFTLFTAGASPRMTEFVEHKYANSTRGRNLFMDEDQQLWIVNRRTKVETQTKRETFLPKKCHPLLTTFLIKYFTLIRPTECALVDYIKGPQAAIIYSEYMWVKGGTHLSETYFYSLMENFLDKYCNVKMNSRDYRQVHVEIGRIFLGSEAEIDEEQVDVLAEQAGHSSKMAQLNYASEVGHLPCMSSDLLLRYGRISEAWWEITGFKPNTPPMLTLKERRLIKQTVNNAHHVPKAAPSPLPLSFNPTTLIQTFTAIVKEEMQNFKTEIKAAIHDEVQLAMAEVLTL
ncbi:hypothetical protein HYPSUDRAFT_146917, partial [Hypholoma sublateritium FD-334 SS-4]